MAIPLLKEDVFDVEQPAVSRPSPRLTLEQANHLAQGRSFELINGRMVFKMPDQEHAQTQILLGSELLSYFKANPLGRVMTELSHRLWPDNSREMRQPDLSVILNENLQLNESYPTRAPDIAIEIISRKDVWTKLFDKAALYFEKGGREVWLVDPYQKGVLVVTPQTRRWEWEVLASPELLPGFRVELKNVFNWPSAETVQ